MTDWDEFVQAHGEIIGFGYGGVFLPVPPGNARAIQIHYEACRRLGADPGVPVYVPKAAAQ